jgi:hypothetical protein
VPMLSSDRWCLQVAATPVDPAAEPQPSSDVSDARWFPVDALPSLLGESRNLKICCMPPSMSVRV